MSYRKHFSVSLYELINSYSVIAIISFILFLNDSMREASLLNAMSLFIMSSVNGFVKKHV